MLARSFTAAEREFLEAQSRFCNAAAVMETLGDFEQVVELGVQLLVNRASLAGGQPPSAHGRRESL